MSFSKREKKILQLKNEGATNEKIGAVLFLSPATVKELSSAIYRKLGVKTGPTAVAKAREMGIIQDTQVDNSSKAEVTFREMEVAELLTQGKSNEVIALELGLKPSTVKGHVSTMLTKFRCKNRIELVSVLLKRGIIQK